MIVRQWGANRWPSARFRANHAAFHLVTPPVMEPVTLTEVKRYLRIDFTDDDALLGILITAARQEVEQFLRRALITQTWDLILDWGPAWVELPYPPLQSVVNIFIRQLDQTEFTVPSTTYYVMPGSRMVGLVPSAIWPVHITPWGWRCQFVAGYGTDPSTVPAAIKVVMYNMIAFAYEQRTMIGAIPLATQQALLPYRVTGEPWRMSKGVEPPELMA
jgi:uncharacterized phiE125 gp8 family phage protein